MSSPLYKKQTQRAKSPASTPGLTGGRSLANRVLSKPEDYPSEFTSWLPRFLAQNSNFQITSLQLPTVETNKIVGDPGNAGFAGGWVYYGSGFVKPHYYKDPFGRVYVGGLIKNGTVGVAAFTLPAGYRPEATEIFSTPSIDLFGEARVDSAGNVIPTVGNTGWFSLDGINFRQFA